MTVADRMPNGKNRDVRRFRLSFHDRTDAPNSENARLAAYWYEKAAEQGIASAQVRIGICYMEGKGVERDPARGFRWYLRAAENDPEGNTAAKGLIGKAYTDGQGTEVDYATAVKWFLHSTNDKYVGWAEHIYLTVMFETGLGVERDPERAAEHRRASYRHPVVEKHPQYRREVDELHEKMLTWSHRMVERLQKQQAHCNEPKQVDRTERSSLTRPADNGTYGTTTK